MAVPTINHLNGPAKGALIGARVMLDGATPSPLLIFICHNCHMGSTGSGVEMTLCRYTRYWELS